MGPRIPARWTHDDWNPAPFLERMVYTRHQPTGQMTVASVPGDTIPRFPFARTLKRK